MYKGVFKPEWWHSKSKGEAYIQFEGDDKKSKCVLNDLLQHNLKVLVYDDSSDSDPSTPLPAARRDAKDPNRTQSIRDDSSDQDSPPSRGQSTQHGSDYEESEQNSPMPSISSDSSAGLQRDLDDLLKAEAARREAAAAAAKSSGKSSGSAAKKQNVSTGGAIPSDDDDHENEEGYDSSEDEADMLSEERREFGKVFATKSTDKTQPAKTLDWTLRDSKKISDMCIRTKVEGAMGMEYGACLKNVKQKETGDVYSIWKHMMPPTWIPKMVETANDKLFDAPVDQNYRKTCAAEVEVILGEMLAGACMGITSFEKCFAITSGTISPAAAFGQYGVSKNRALTVMRSMHLADGPQQPSGKETHWFLDETLGEFNRHMSICFSPSWLGTMDETGPMWHGAEGEGDFNACPHVSFVPRKPEPICAEFNDSACALSRVMTQLEFEKAKKYHDDEKYVAEIGSYNAAMTTRLAEPFANRNAAVYGDSRFCSVKAAYHVWKNHKTHFAGDVKTATALFPRKDLVRLCPKQHGEYIVMSANLDGLELFAVGQRRGKAVHTFLTTFGTFLAEIPSRFHKVTSLKDAPWTTPSILNKVTEAQPAIDAINRQLFDQLGMQYTFPTRCFETRFAQHFMLPLTYVNAINFAKYSLEHKYGDETTKSIGMELATAMVHNAAWTAMKNSASGPPPANNPGTSRSGGRYQEEEKTWRQCRIDGGPPSRESPGKHVLIPIRQLPGYKGGRQQRCWECNELVSWCCARCSTPNAIVALHPTVAQGSKRAYGCLHAHRKNPCGGYKVTHEACSGTSATSKRRRKVSIEFI